MCINIDQKATDPENDIIGLCSIGGYDWTLFFNTAGVYTLKVAVADSWGLRSDDTIIQITVEDD
jgi:hypothetical protein